MAFLLDGKKLPLDTPFSVGDTKYPANWLRLTTLEEKKAIGITEIADDPVYDSRFYWNDGSAKPLNDVNATYSKDASDGSYKKGDLMKDENGKQVVELGVKSLLIAAEKETAGQALAPYDWYVVRKAEKGTAIPTDITTFRDKIRTTCSERETAIKDASDTAALVKLFGSTKQSDGSMKTNLPQYSDVKL